MAKTQQEGRPVIDHRTGRYRAYDKAGTLIWEAPEFTIGTDKIPWGLSICMAAAEITDAKGERLHKWDPQDMLS